MEKVGLVLEGGAYRGIFTAGALDLLIDEGIRFPYVVGVSAGSGNAINYIAGQRERTRKVITHENATPYFGLRTLFKTGKLLNLDVMLYTYCYKQIPFDFDAYFSSTVEREYTVVCCESGEPEYLTDGGDPDRLLEVCKASCSVPFACKPVELDGRHYLDGSLADSVPFERAFAKGCDRAVVILTRGADDQPTDYSKNKRLAKLFYGKKYPKLYDALMLRFERYEQTMEKLLEQERAGRLLVVRPAIPTIKHFEGNAEKVRAYYDHGYEQMRAALPALREFLGATAPVEV